MAARVWPRVYGRACMAARVWPRVYGRACMGVPPIAPDAMGGTLMHEPGEAIL